MVQEKFLQQAISIRRTYLKLLNSMDLYKSRAMKVSERLQETLGKLEDFQKDLSKDDKNMDKSEILSKLIGIIDEIQDEGTRLEKLIEPINFEIEKRPAVAHAISFFDLKRTMTSKPTTYSFRLSVL